MSVLNEVEAVLAEVKRPQHADEITERVFGAGRLENHGQDPRGHDHRPTGGGREGERGAVEISADGAGRVALRAWGLSEHHSSPEAGGNGLGAKQGANRPAPAKPATKERLSFTDAAERVLESSGARAPMHYKMITRQALDLGLVATAGKTPESTLYASVFGEIRRQTRRGERPRFAMHGKGYVGLTRWMATGLAFQIDQHNQQARKKPREQIGTKPPADFEALGDAAGEAGLRGRDGNRPQRGRRDRRAGDDGDGGRDPHPHGGAGEALEAERARPGRAAGAGQLGVHEQGLIITTSDFIAGAKEEAERPASPALPVDYGRCRSPTARCPGVLPPVRQDPLARPLRRGTPAT